MTKILWTVLLGLGLIIAACASPSTPLPPASTEAPAVPETGFITSKGVVASAKVVPAHETQMSFAISAPIKEVDVSEGDLVRAGQTLLSLHSPDLELSITEAEAAAKAKELEYVYWVPRLDRPPERREQARAEMKQARANLEIAKAMFAQTILLAPFDATVVEIGVQAGELARAGQAVITLGDLADFQIETTDLSERDVTRLQAGASVDVFVTALSEHFAGKVIRVSPISDTVGGDVVFPVTISFDEQPTGLLWGMSAEVNIQTTP